MSKRQGKVRILELKPDRKARWSSGEPDHLWVVNHKDQRAHTISTDRVFAANKPITVHTLEYLEQVKAPEPDPSLSNFMVAVQQSNIIPEHPAGKVPNDMAQLEVLQAVGITAAQAHHMAREDTEKADQAGHHQDMIFLGILVIMSALAVIAIWQVFLGDIATGVVDDVRSVLAHMVGA